LFRTLPGDQLDRNVTLAELAAVAGMGTFQLAKGFTRHFGLPPHAVHLRLRLDRAQTLLRGGARPAAVAEATGFADQAHFSRRFRRAFGVTPGVYRRQDSNIGPSPTG
jgi:AraC-like DNA-binding protein